MTIIWRGAGILVPILLFLSGWITSYWYEDTSLGNVGFMSWTLLWPGILLTLFGLLVLPISKNEETGKWEYIGNHDLFWIPMVVWGIGFLGYSIKFFNEGGSDEDVTEYAQPYEEVQDKEMEPEAVIYPMNKKDIAEGERIIKFYNPTDKTISIKLYDEGGKYKEVDGDIPALGVEYTTVKAANYILEYNKIKVKMQVEASKTINNYDSDELWFVLDTKTDLLLVDITETCYKDLTSQKLPEIEFMDKVYNRYSGKKPIEMDVEQELDKYFTIRDPYYSLPITHTKEEQHYAIIPIPTNVKTTDAFIDEFLGNICFKTEGVTVH